MIDHEQATKRALDLLTHWKAICYDRSLNAATDTKLLVAALTLEIENVYQSGYDAGYRQGCIDEDAYLEANSPENSLPLS